MVVETQPKLGTSHAYKFATVSIVISGERFILYAVPVDSDISKAEVVEKLLNYAKRKVKIKRVYLDRGFFSIDVIEKLNELKVKFVMPAIRNPKIKELMEKYDSPKVIKYTMGEGKRTADFNLVIVKPEDGDSKVVFATNIDVRGGGAYVLFDLYSRRWGIETSYRVKECFRARTTSKNYIVRLFYFMFSVVLYNLWILINIILALFLLGKLSEKPVITAKLFGTFLYIDSGGG
jgi:putative transposase